MSMGDSFQLVEVVTVMAYAVFLGILVLHFFLFKKSKNQERLHQIRLADLQKLVDRELERSREYEGIVDMLKIQKENTQDKLDLIKLQIEALKKGEKKD